MPKVVMVYALVAFTAALQSQPVASPVRADARYTVRGTVVNSVTGEPIRRALVQLSGAVSKQMLTDESGGFEFSGIPEGQAGIMARKPGFFSQSEAAREGVDQQLIEVGGNTGPLTVKLIPEAVLTGRVVSEVDEPLESVPVAILAVRINEGRKQWETVGVARTDEDGLFRVANLTPGNYYVRSGPVVGNRFAGLRSVNRRFGYGTLYYPAASTRDAATAIELRAGEHGQADFVLKREPLFHVTAIVNGASGEPGPSLRVLDSEGDPVPVPMRLAGSFEFTLPAGNYLLRAETARFGDVVSTATRAVTVQSDLDGIKLNLTTSVSIPVLVHRQSVRQHSRSASFSDWIPVNIELRSRDLRLPGQLYLAKRSGRTEEEVVVPHVAPGRYAVSLRGNGGWYVAEARCGGTDLLTEDLVVPEGAQMPPIEIDLRDDGATLTGMIEMGKQKKRPSVLIMHVRTMEQPILAHVYNNGIYSHGALAPGDYEVIALDRLESIEYANPEVWSKFEGQAVRVHLQPEEDSRMDLPLMRGVQ